MTNARNHSVHEVLRNGERIEIRALRHDDRDALTAAVENASDQLIHRRFFGPRRQFTEQEISNFVDVDFVNHVALVAVTDEAGQQPQIVGGGRYIVVQPGEAEVAFTVIDRFQGQGLGTILLKHISMLARDAGLHALIAEVLSENIPMLKVFRNCGFPISITRAADVTHVRLQLR